MNLTPGNGFTLDIMLDAASLGRLHAFNNYEAFLEPALLNAQEASLSMIQASATDFMWSHFRNPGGALEEAWEVDIQSPYLGILTNTSPYGQRRNYGFSNKTDALGRYYAHDPGIGWAELTLAIMQYKVRDQFQAAVDYANLKLGGI